MSYFCRGQRDLKVTVSVRPSVCPSVRPLVPPSVRPTLLFRRFGCLKIEQLGYQYLMVVYAPAQACRMSAILQAPLVGRDQILQAGKGQGRKVKKKKKKGKKKEKKREKRKKKREKKKRKKMRKKRDRKIFFSLVKAWKFFGLI